MKEGRIWVLSIFWVVKWKQNRIRISQIRVGVLVPLLAAWVFFKSLWSLHSDKGGSPEKEAVFIPCCAVINYHQVSG